MLMSNFIAADYYHYHLKDEEINVSGVTQLNLNYKSSALCIYAVFQVQNCIGMTCISLKSALMSGKLCAEKGNHGS